MIELSNKWYLTAGPSENDFCLIERKAGKNPKTGESTVSENKTYHPSLDMVSQKVAKSECIDAVKACETLKEIKGMLDGVQMEVADACKRYYDENL